MQKISFSKVVVTFILLLSWNAVASYAQGLNYPGTPPLAQSGTGNARTDPDNLFIKNNVAGLTEIPVDEEEERSGVLGTSNANSWRLWGELQAVYFRYNREFFLPGSMQPIKSRATVLPPNLASEITYTSKDHKYGFGFGVFQTFGFQSKFEDPIEKLGPNALFFDTKIASSDVAFGGSVRLHRSLSFGAAFIFGRAFLDLKAPSPLLASIGIIQQSRVNLTDIGGPGAIIGIHVRPSNKVSFGFQYKSKRTFDLDGDLETVLPAPSSGGLQLFPVKLDVTAKIKVPAIFESGIQVRPTEKLLLAADFRFYDYSDALDQVIVRDKSTGNILLPQRIDTEDVRLYIVGGIYSMNENTKIHFGAAYVTNGIPTGLTNPGLFNAGATQISGGIGKKIYGQWVNLSVMGILGRERIIDPSQNIFSGKFTSGGVAFSIGLRLKL